MFEILSEDLNLLMTKDPYFIAEISSNHSKNIERALKFIDTSKEVGCDAVKFQLFRINKLFAPEILARSHEHQKRKEWELPYEFLPIISAKTKELGMEFACTPFDLEAVDILYPHVDFYKISSYELLWEELIRKCAETRKPLVLSTGMATEDEIKNAISVFKEVSTENLTILHTVSGYPTPVNEANLAAIKTLQKQHGINVGLSDHSVSEAVLLRAAHRWNAEVIEFHLDLDGFGEEYKSGHCWLPNKIKTTIELIKNGFKADGTGIKMPMPSEVKDRTWRTDPVDGLRPMIETRKNFKDE